MRLSLASLLVLILGCSWTVTACAQPASSSYQGPTPPHTGIDVQHYAFSLTLADTTDRMEGTATARVRATTDTLTSVRLDLVGPNGDTGMTVSSVTEDGTSVPATQARDHLYIQPATPLRDGDERTYVIRYSGIPADGLIIGTNRHGDRTFFGDNWPNRARHWLPVVDHPSDKATVEWTVTTPAAYRTVANGALRSDTTRASTRTTHWVTDVPLPTKVAVIGVAPFAVDTVATVDGVPVQSWVYPQDRTAGFRDLGQAPPILRFFEEKLGPYPYAKLANVQSSTRYGGMENASSIFYSEQAVADGQDSTPLLAHEIAHQWFGNVATEADWPHLWLSEGVATYLTGLYIEHLHGPERLAQYIKAARRSALNYSRQHPTEPLVDTTYSDPNELLTVNPYRRGAWVLHMLRDRIGTDVFWTGMRTYYERFRNANATTADFRRVMEDVSGEDLRAFFDQWTRRPGHPQVVVTWRHDADTEVCVVDVRQTQDAPPFAFNLDLSIDGRIESVTVNERSHRVQMDCPEEPNALIPDPNTTLLAEIEAERK